MDETLGMEINVQSQKSNQSIKQSRCDIKKANTLLALLRAGRPLVLQMREETGGHRLVLFDPRSRDSTQETV